MSEKNQDIFVQIDALLDRHGSEALREKVCAVDDFPMLTEVIEAADEIPSCEVHATLHSGEWHQKDASSSMHRLTDAALPNDTAAVQVSRMQSFSEQQLAQIQTLIRQIVQEELQKLIKP